MYSEQSTIDESSVRAIFTYLLQFFWLQGVGDGYQEEGELYHAMLAARIGMLSQELQAVK